MRPHIYVVLHEQLCEPAETMRFHCIRVPVAECTDDSTLPLQASAEPMQQQARRSWNRTLCLNEMS